MDIVLVGANGKLGSAVHETLRRRGHRVITAGRSSGDVRVNITDRASVSELFDAVGAVDSVASAAGVTPFRLIQELTADDFTSAYVGKVRGQIELVRQGIHKIAISLLRTVFRLSISSANVRLGIYSTVGHRISTLHFCLVSLRLVLIAVNLVLDEFRR